MKIKLKTIYASPVVVHQPNSVVDFPEEDAQALIAGGYAVADDIGPADELAADLAGGVEAAALPPAETATSPAAKARGKRR